MTWAHWALAWVLVAIPTALLVAAWIAAGEIDPPEEDS